ncbi:MAG: GerMN domain-containing protein [Deltaproteobacteria bacterium]|nr:GerMN domain-containing protein [Deltaproteobacteria bacterium]
MTAKKQKKNEGAKNRKKKKSSKFLVLFLLVGAVSGFLIFFFVSLFDFVYPPVSERETLARKEKMEATLYFSDANERFLVPEKRYIVKEKNATGQAKELVKALLEGSKMGHVDTFPKKTDIESITVEKDQTAIVNFGKNLIKLHPGGSASEVATIYSLTNTLVSNIPDIKRVKVLIDGKERESLKGHVDMRYPFVLNKGLFAPAGKEG